MSLFRPYQYKNRPDLLDNAPVKKGVFRFLELYFRKFWRFLSVNILYFLATLPMLLYVFYTVNGLFADKLGNQGILLAGLGFLASFFSFIPSVLELPLLVLSVLLYGPLTMGMTYMFRNFAREEHAWGSDLWSRAWSNAGQGVFFGLLDLVLTLVFVNGMFSSVVKAGQTLGYGISIVLSVLSGIAFVIWYFMRHYTYLMAVTVNLNVFRILKNAWLFVVLGFGRNVICGLVTLACLVVTFLLNQLLTVFTLPFFFYSFSWFCTVFTCYPIVKKYIIVPALEAEQQNEAQSAPATSADGPIDEEGS